MDENKLFSVGVVGYSAGEFDKEKAYKYMIDGLKTIIDNNKFNSYKDIEIVSGFTDYGIPAIAYRVADYFNIKTVGFACNKAIDENMELYSVDEGYIKGDNWGDESDYFLERIDALIRIGGGNQAHEETEKFKENNDKNKIVEFDLERY